MWWQQIIFLTYNMDKSTRAGDTLWDMILLMSCSILVLDIMFKIFKRV